MKIETITKELRRIMIDNHRCFGCGHEHSCSTRGCAIMRNAADVLEVQQARIAELEAELKEERYRHDRVQDFEVAEAQLLAKLREERRWIPVGERLPDLVPCGAGTAYSEAVNVLTDGRKVLTAIWNGTRFLCDADYWEAWDETITHWTPVLLPLPEPPEEGDP